MTYETILSRSFSRHEQKKMGRGAFMGCFVMAFALCTVFKPYLGPLPLMNSGLKMLIMGTEEISEQSHIRAKSVKPIIHNFTNSRSQVYEMNGDIRIHGNSSTIFIASTQELNITSWTITPYARKGDKVAMGKVRKFRIMEQPTNTTPHCSRNFSIPAIVFSSGGYAGNHFHDFTDMLIPLYLTSQQFNRTVLFLVADKRPWWASKYKLILEKLSKYDVIDIDNENEVLCFSRMIVGLKAHKELSIDPSESPHYSVRDFRKFLRSTYSLDREFVNHHRRPRLLIVSRRKTRHLTNEGEVAEMARSLGFDVAVKEMGWQVSSVAQFVNSFDVMIGVHGAGLTNMVFLPENAVVIQIVPFGLDLLAKYYFQTPAKDMKLRYLEYKVILNESSLLGKYPPDSDVFRDPVGVHEKGWHAFRSVYLDNQDVNVDLGRFRKTLLKALELFSFPPREGQESTCRNGTTSSSNYYLRAFKNFITSILSKGGITRLLNTTVCLGIDICKIKILFIIKSNVLCLFFFYSPRLFYRDNHSFSVQNFCNEKLIYEIKFIY
ncbi:hypothetical protein Pfo_030875 [Paulownia fortunei]|nr:hypothetical protein Pfo_030875 [Paulownia fortunei]